MPHDDMQARLTRLEENSLFQDRALDEFNCILTAQQRQVDELEQRLVRAETLVRLLLDQLSQSGGRGADGGAGGADEVPPHYQFVR